MTLVYSRRKFWPWAVPVIALVMCVSVTWMCAALAQAISANSGPQWYPMVRPNLFSSAVVFDPKNPKIVYEGGATGIFKSTDGGTSWRAINYGLTNVIVYSLVIDPVTTTTLYAGTDGGVFKSINGGKNWAAQNNGIQPTNINTLKLPPIISIAIMPSSPSNIYAASYGRGLLYSSDSGNSWTSVGGGLPVTLPPETPSISS
jgi:photosystem II stability/assembly factor-like uncharacterized protein